MWAQKKFFLEVRIMADHFDMARARYSCRDFDGEEVSRDDLRRCIEAASLAPSACNSQPWSFIAVTTQEAREKIAKCAEPQEGWNRFAAKAGAFVIALEEHAVLNTGIRKLLDSQTFAAGDLGGAVYGFCLAASSLGLGTCIMGIFDRETVREMFDLPADKRIALLIAVGRPREEREHVKRRKPVDEIIRWA